jgi:Mg2+-importing ATPase
MNSELPQWSQNIEDVLHTVQSREEGLSHTEARERFLRDGKNEITMHSRATLLTILLSQLFSPLICILLFAGGVTFYLEEWLEAIVIFIAVFINVALAMK